MTAPCIGGPEIAVPHVRRNIRVIIHRPIFSYPIPGSHRQSKPAALKAKLRINSVPTSGQWLLTAIGLMHQADINETSFESEQIIISVDDP